MFSPRSRSFASIRAHRSEEYCVSNEYGDFCVMSTLDSGPDNVRSLAKAPSGRSDLQSIFCRTFGPPT
ncbi:hypothetical protein M404DRAFT_993478 [Pisolithus tinctorius Marx 270]|uniref:Uncharacterized protein n=1 Tax=Pisolithus tinctorius Marx 270 TaxID=870435 RepID=A0A0C3PF50_PISTI|nr:hypothetical protein M404DRAFT_993478 [Pisolithus tinctorius Marx 270]